MVKIFKKKIMELIIIRKIITNIMINNNFNKEFNKIIK